MIQLQKVLFSISRGYRREDSVLDTYEEYSNIMPKRDHFCGRLPKLLYF